MNDATDIRSGELFAGRYEVQEVLAEGLRKRTYLALDKKMDRKVALSVVKSEAMPLDPEGTEREARVLGQIGSHDNIVSLYDYDEKSKPQYTVFEYLSGGTLVDYLGKTGLLPRENVLQLGRQVCRGLAHLHGRGLLHRDMSPRNILLDERGNAHLGDFDSAMNLDEQASQRPVTTNAFAAPEELEGQTLDVRSDLYSLGGVLYVLATGAERLGDMDSLRRDRPDLSTSYAELVESLISRDPSDRPQDADAVLGWLDDIRNMSNIEALITAGEGSEVEFKSSLHHPHGPLPPNLLGRVECGEITLEQAAAEVKKELRLSVTKTVAAFLNSEGGTLLIGVDDSGEVLGIEDDLRYLSKQNPDYWLLDLRQVITADLDMAILASIRISLVPHGKVSVAVIRCRRRAAETWHGKDKKKVFFIRAGNSTVAVEGPDLLKYARERWPG